MVSNKNIFLCKLVPSSMYGLGLIGWKVDGELFIMAYIF